MNVHQQFGLFDPVLGPAPKPGRQRRRLKVLVTVKAAPNPSATYGETVCVAGVSVDPDHPGWIRLYPINFRNLEGDIQFRKYQIVEVDAAPAASDPRSESWRPDMTTMRVTGEADGWKRRRPLLAPYFETSMCAINAASHQPAAQSLALIKIAEVRDILIEPHPGWTDAEQRKIDGYVGQLDLFGSNDRSALKAPRLKARYWWFCQEPQCRGHKQGLLDWEFVAFQRRFNHLPDDALVAAVRTKFLEEVCGPTKDVAFYVGNQAKRHHVFSVLGMWWPPR